MGTDKRQRQKERRRAQQLAWADQDRRARNRTRVLVYGGVFVLIVVAALGALALFGGDEADTPVAGELPAGVPTTLPPDPPQPVVVTVPPPGATLTGETPCPLDDGATERTTTFEGPPPLCIDPALDYRAEITTTKGAFVVDLDPEGAPNTVNNFVVLARYGYYDGVAFHRIIPGFVVQGGDATGPDPGVGDAGYRFADEPPTELAADDASEDQATSGRYYEIGSIAMANSGEDTNGSQFFVVTGDRGADLPPLYSRFGIVSEGLDVVLDIEAIGSASGAPTEVVTIESITITEQERSDDS